MPKFKIDELVSFKGKEAIIADHLKGKYLLWDKSGVKELEIPKEYETEWIPESDINKI